MPFVLSTIHYLHKFSIINLIFLIYILIDKNPDIRNQDMSLFSTGLSYPLYASSSTNKYTFGCRCSMDAGNSG